MNLNKNNKNICRSKFLSSKTQKNSPPDIVSPWIENNSTSRIVCSCNRNYNHNHNEGSDVSDISAPQISRTPSSICPASPIYQDIIPDNSDRLDDVDGLPVIHCDVQMRVQQIIMEHKVLILINLAQLFTNKKKFRVE